MLTVSDIESTVDFYTSVMGMQRVSFAGGRVALGFGDQKINLHQSGHEFEPKAVRAVVGSADLCFIISTPISDVEKYLRDCGVPVIEGRVKRSCAKGPIMSLYFRDPDHNLIEISNYINPD